MTMPDLDHLTPEQLRALADEDLQALLGDAYQLGATACAPHRVLGGGIFVIPLT